MSLPNTNLVDADLPLFAPDDTPPVEPGRTLSYLRDHRERLRERFVRGGAASMPDYELLELILFRAIPRRDVKPLAHRLIETFGDLGRILAASQVQLLKVPDIGPAVVLELKLFETVAHRIARSKVMHRPVVSDWAALLDYCHVTMTNRETEQFRVPFLDTKNAVIADEDLGHGTVDHVPVYPREVVKRALEVNAKALILVHNHPSGDPTPSQSDIDMTAQIGNACAVLGLTLHDHLIIGRGAQLSFRAEGYL
ncbi:DNA repair protein RadC [Maribius pontilimi]|uniref:DNA repair protein RadC n=1 Tax=Palleronia pontilimi TaxID=1964209 RepID=A0A934IGT1_9RHOB|nr:DNA repair protein RadC [Palleronia pontilimi]MBJ3761594.1 DNA repair protein RadC [Palleronia pontilimi]